MMFVLSKKYIPELGPHSLYYYVASCHKSLTTLHISVIHVIQNNRKYSFETKIVFGRHDKVNCKTVVGIFNYL